MLSSLCHVTWYKYKDSASSKFSPGMFTVFCAGCDIATAKGMGYKEKEYGIHKECVRRRSLQLDSTAGKGDERSEGSVGLRARGKGRRSILQGARANGAWMRWPPVHLHGNGEGGGDVKGRRRRGECVFVASSNETQLLKASQGPRMHNK